VVKLDVRKNQTSYNLEVREYKGKTALQEKETEDKGCR
jgi:hypothetical protein